MDKETIERKVKIEIEFFRIYSFFIIGLVTGIFSIALTGIYKFNNLAFITLIIGIAFLLFFATVFVISFIKLNKLKK